jgi:AraC-like DNA-binding protein
MRSIELGDAGIFGAIILFGAFQGYSLSTVFWLRSRGDRVANRLLATLILMITLHLSEIFLDITGLLARVPYLSGVTFPLIFLLGPTFYLYLRRQAGPDLRFRPSMLLHAVPCLLCVAAVWPWYWTPLEPKARYLASKTWGGNTPLDLKTYLLLFLNVGQNFTYAFLGERLLRRREQALERLVADNDAVRSMGALRKIARAFSFYAGGYFLLFVALLIWDRYTAEVDTVWLVCIALFWQVLGYSAIDQPETFSHLRWLKAGAGEGDRETDGAGDAEGNGHGDDDAEAEADGDDAPTESEPRTPRPKYAKAALKPERSRQIMERVRHLMEEQRLFLDGDLKLSDVARALNASLHHVSQAINRESDCTFLELVNRYRVEEAKRMLADPDCHNLTVLAIGFEAGFNNKASFNQAFKKYTRQTPSAFRKEPVT